jgi:hypothetical protein
MDNGGQHMQCGMYVSSTTISSLALPSKKILPYDGFVDS